MKSVLNLICGIFTLEKDSIKVAVSDIDEEIRRLVDPATTEKDIIERLNAILAAFKFSKFDVYDFKKTVEKLSATIPQEKMLYTSVLTTSADLGTTKSDIIQSIRYYSGMLSNFSDRSKTYVDNVVKSVDDSTKEKIEALLKQKEENKKTMEQLLSNNVEIDSTISKLNSDAQKYVADLKLVKDNIVKVVHNCVQSLKTEKQKCDKHLA